jgi:hypothetical protein
MFTTSNKAVVRFKYAALIFLISASLYLVPAVLANPVCSPTATGC